MKDKMEGKKREVRNGGMREEREGRERAGLWGDGALSDAGRDHLDESGARSLTVNTGLPFHMEPAQGTRFKHPLGASFTAIHPKQAAAKRPAHVLVQNTTRPRCWQPPLRHTQHPTLPGFL